ncbi:MAG: aspartate aminotransferase family protein [Planctomycetes bacterium]|nr:aspartate aminotransferase family protein [Planctomycetota bacterium]
MTHGSAQDSREREDRYTLNTYPKLPFALVRGEGSYIFDDAGRRYLDLYGGHAVSCLGHGHPRWVEAIAKQAAALDFYSNICYHPLRAEAAERVVRNSYPSMAGVYFCNSGAEANETALKIARKLTRRPLVVAMNEGFHGRTIGALSVTGVPKMRDAFPESLAGLTRFVDLGDMRAIEALDPRQVAAVILEPILSLAGVRLAPPEHYRALRAHCTRHGIALIFDEVQTGNGRTGKWFAGHHWGVEPDIVTTAKALAGGFPVGAVIANRWVAADVKTGDQGSTFGGGPLAVAAVAATYRILEEEGIVGAVARRSEAVLSRLRSLVGRGPVREVRGLGYLIGVECEIPAGILQARLLEEGVLVGTSNHAGTFRLLPPLTVTEEEWETFFRALEKVLSKKHLIEQP